MYQRKPRRFRRRSNERRYLPRSNGDMQARRGSNAFVNGQTRNNFRNTLSVEKLFEKYNNLSKEAMSSGDQILSENYLQHADHFMRIIKDKQRNQNEHKPKIISQMTAENKTLSNTSENNQDKTTKNKE